ncbi:MAG: molecular chaperone TorD family protein [bacterium]|nr:molecular chaperone TorD family protein [bacterium]
MKPVEELFVDELNIKFWKREGEKNKNLYWVKSMLDIDQSLLYPEISNFNHKEIDLLSLSKSRMTVYSILKDGFDNPTHKLAIDLTSANMISNISTFEIDMEVVELFEQYLGKDSKEVLNDLKEEYTRLIYDSYMPFIPPYESIYRGERQVQGKFTWEVSNFYKEFDLIVDGKEMPDHIVHECEFISILSSYEYENRKNENIKEAEKYHKAISEFLDKHLLIWGNKFCLDLVSLTKVPFYRAMALLGKSIFTWENNYIKRGVYEKYPK